MKSIVFMFCGLALPLGALRAQTYQDKIWSININLPKGWHVDEVVESTGRVLYVRPHKREDLDRGGVKVKFYETKLKSNQALIALKKQFESNDGMREAATFTSLDTKRGRLLVDFKQGEYVQNQLWILRRHQRVYQTFKTKHGTKAFVANCSANASEFKHYIKPFYTVCQGFHLNGAKQ